MELSMSEKLASLDLEVSLLIIKNRIGDKRD